MSQSGTTNSFPLQFVGRPKCAGGATKGGPQRQMPSAHFTTKQVVKFFETTFGFSANETVAPLLSRCFLLPQIQNDSTVGLPSRPILALRVPAVGTITRTVLITNTTENFSTLISFASKKTQHSHHSQSTANSIGKKGAPGTRKLWSLNAQCGHGVGV